MQEIWWRDAHRNNVMEQWKLDEAEGNVVVAKRASLDPPRELWSWDSPSEMSELR